jgi:predicted nucleic acid-binding protein
MKFWDSSAILPLLLDEPETPAVKQLLAQDADIVLWWATPVECISGLCRLRREGKIENRALAQLIADLDDLLLEADGIEPSNPVRDAAAKLLRIHALVAADALQLAAAFLWAGRKPAQRQFVSLDRKLREAAAAEGFHVLPVAR